MFKFLTIIVDAVTYYTIKITKIPKTPPISCIKNPVTCNKAKALSVWWVKPHGHRSAHFNVVEVSFHTRVIHLLNMFVYLQMDSLILLVSEQLIDL